MDNSDNLVLGTAVGAAGDIAGAVGSLFKTNYTPPAGFTQVAMEGESATFPKAVDLAYGANGRFKYKRNFTGKAQFTNAFFGGDPIKKKKKAGYAKAVDEATAALISTPSSGDQAVAEKTVPTGTGKILPYVLGALAIGAVIYFATKN